MSDESVTEAIVLLQRQSSNKSMSTLLESVALPKSKYTNKEKEAVEHLSNKLGVKLQTNEVVVREFVSWEEFTSTLSKEIEELGGFKNFSFSIEREQDVE